MLHGVIFLFFVVFFPPICCNVLKCVLVLISWRQLKVPIASTCPVRPTIRARTAACVWRSWTSDVSLRASAVTVAEASPAPAAKSTWTSAPPARALTASATTVRSRVASPASFDSAYSRRRRTCVCVQAVSVSA